MKKDKKAAKTSRSAYSGSFFDEDFFDSNSDGKKIVDYCLENLHGGDRFLFIAGNAAGLTEEETKKLDIALPVDYGKGEYQKIEQIIKEEFAERIAGIVIPAELGEQAAKGIERAAQPASAAHKKKVIIYSLIAGALCLLTAGLLVYFSAQKPYGKTDNRGQTQNPAETQQPEDDSGQDTNPPAEQTEIYADIEITGYGKITIELDKSAAPITVENFVSLAENGFYDGLTFHRIMKGFMIQGGDPLGTGYGGSEKTIIGEFSANGYDNPLSHTRGTVSMARSKAYNSASSQFFIVHEDTLSLDGDYAAFGKVTEGMEVVDKICAEAEPIDGNGTIPAQEQPVIKSIKIRRQ
ncbi:MAG: peptidylprolyl isomerase [Eubacteriaceae bacterium]|nr:peptidylprolyl isomerase [Eubacteriaceae bacterium]